MSQADAPRVVTDPAPGSALEALRQAGVPGFDPVRWHYIEVLAAKSQTQNPATQALLQDKLASALSQLRACMEGGREAGLSEAKPTHGPHRVAREATPSPLAQLLKDWPRTAHTPGKATTPAQTAPLESPRARQFRKTLASLHVQKQVTQALAQAPQNAGPINSHMLVLRSLGLMRAHSPEYLNRFMAYVDTLLCLEEAGKTQPSAKKTAGNKPKK